MNKKINKSPYTTYVL